jgi:DNA repair protein RecN (Recombination protein N)
VLVVTHLAQVAACADQHVVVTKHVRAGQTFTLIGAVEGEDRVVEVARMLSGSPDSGSAREHAGELLTAAERERTD